MNIPLDEVIYFDCVTTHPSTGAATDADSTPTFAVYEEATDTDIGIGGNLTKRTSLTGNYRGTFTLSAANGFEVGKWYSIIGSATVNAIAGKAVLKNFRVVAAEAIAGKVKVDVDALLGTAWLTPGTPGTPDVRVTAIANGIIAAATFAANALDAVWSTATRLLTAGTNIVLTKGTGVTGFNDLDAAGVRSAVGLASANLDTQLDALPTNAELGTALGTADDAVLTAIADLPTNAELATALGTADDAVLAQLALVKAKTDSLTFTVAGQVDANVQRINDVTIVGDGSATPFNV